MDVRQQEEVDVLLREEVDDALEEVVDDLLWEAVDDVLLQVVDDVLLQKMGLGGDDSLWEDAAQCYLLMDEDDPLHCLEGPVDCPGELWTLSSNQPIDPVIHQISFFAFRCRVPSIVENVPDLATPTPVY